MLFLRHRKRSLLSFFLIVSSAPHPHLVLIVFFHFLFSSLPLIFDFLLFSMGQKAKVRFSLHLCPHLSYIPFCTHCRITLLKTAHCSRHEKLINCAGVKDQDNAADVRPSISASKSEESFLLRRPSSLTLLWIALVLSHHEIGHYFYSELPSAGVGLFGQGMKLIILERTDWLNFDRLPKAA